MKAAIIEKPGVMSIKDIDVPKIKSDEILIKVQSSSICNATDNHIYHGVFDGYHDFYPQIMGHEVAGEVVEVGSDVKVLALGDTIALYTPRGAFCEYTVVKPIGDMWVRVPKSIPLRVRSLVEMFHGAYVSTVYPALLKSDETVLIVGQGPMGMTAAATAKLSAKKVITVDLNEFRVKKSLEIGADLAFNRSSMSTQDIIAEVLKETGGNGVDAAVVCISEDRSNELDAFDMTLSALKYGGRVTGLFVDAKGIESNHRVNPHQLLRKEATFAHTLNHVYHKPEDELKVFQDAVDKVAEGKINLESMITHEVGLNELEHALDLCINGMNETVKVVVYPR